MKKCKGCGVTLQTSDINLEGYVKDISQDYCMRCFRLIHYGDTNKLNKEKISNSLIIKQYEEFKNNIFVLIIDSFDFLTLYNDDLLDIFKDLRLILVVNKIDLLPRNIKDDKMEDIFKDVLSKCYTKNIINCLLTYKNDQTFNELFFETLKETNENKFVFVGRVNAGKTTIINKLLNSNELTVSPYPGTTVNSNEVEIDGYKFIDTPGLIDEASFINKLEKNKIKALIPNKCVKPKIFQLYEPQSYFVEGLIRIDINPRKNASITFYIKNELEVHRSKLVNGDNYLDKHQKEFKLKCLPFKENRLSVNNEITYYLKGLGFIRIIGKCNAKISVHKDIKIYKCEVRI